LSLLAWLLSGRQGQDRDRVGTAAWRLGALWSWLFATSWLVGTFSWLFVAMHTYGGLSGALAALAVLTLAALLALYYAAAGALFVALAPAHRAGSALIFAALWLLAELARGVWLTGFGWGASAYAQVGGPLAGLAAWIGVYGLCALTAWVAMTLQHLIQPSAGTRPQGLSGWCLWRARTLHLLPLVLVFALAALAEQPGETTKSTGHIAVTLLQGNIPQSEKFDTGSGVPLALQWYAEQLQASRTALVIAPETAIPVLPQQLTPVYWQAMQDRFASGTQAALIGIPLGNYQSGYTNSVLGFQPGQTQPWRYDKQHLVPFGEFIPPLFKWFTALMNIPLGDFNRGALKQVPFEWQGQRLATNICYEDLFSEELGLHFDDPTQAPTIFVNVSNLAWFGDTLAQDQHLQIARMRALEFARPFVLATNTGTTAILDYRGHVVASLPRDTRSVLVAEVEGRSGITPYAWWLARFGLWPLWLLALAVVLPTVAARWRRRQVIAPGLD
jgi:apolipoprotein N-acyltransferase